MPDDKFSQLEEQYAYNADAEALFFKGKYQDPAMRLEVPDMNLEFTDGFYIESDPKGRFYYNNDFDNINMTKEPQAKYTVETTYVNQKPYVNIKLYYVDRSQQSPYAEFLVAHSLGLDANPGWIGNTNHTGNWKKQAYSRSSALVEKAVNSTKVTVTSTIVHKKAEITTEQANFKNQSEKIKVYGTLYLKDTEAIDNAHYARWCTDHIVFYRNSWSGNDFSGFFFPLEYKQGSDETTTLGSENNKVYSGVQWSHA